MAGLQNLQRATNSFFESVCRKFEESLRDSGAVNAQVSWATEESGVASDLQWWAGSLAGTTEKCVFLGTNFESTNLLGFNAGTVESQALSFPALVQCVQAALDEKLGTGELAGSEISSSEIPTSGLVRVIYSINQNTENGDPAEGALEFLLDARLEAKLTKTDGLRLRPQAGPQATQASLGGPMDLLMRVEVPVSVTFGSTRVRMRELLSLTAGSVVELDQTLGEQVEVRVNNCLIARGEVVAVDGNYGVRIVELAAGGAALMANGSTR